MITSIDLIKNDIGLNISKFWSDYLGNFKMIYFLISNLANDVHNIFKR